MPLLTVESRSILMDSAATVATKLAARAALQSTPRRSRARAVLPVAGSSAAFTRLAKPLRAVATGSERIAAPIRE